MPRRSSLEQDAARYRFLRQHLSRLIIATEWIGRKQYVVGVELADCHDLVMPKSVDQAVDKLMKNTLGDDSEEHH